jgi:Chromo (CHRromatin Organisation MOdifier) domain
MHPTAKLGPKRYGPFPVTKVMSLVVFKLQLLTSWKIHNVFHTSLLSPYKEMEEHGMNYEEPPPDLIDGEHEYEVEQILDARHHGCWKKLQYCIWWKGYSKAHDTWEPEENVHAPNCLSEFTQNHLQKALALNIKMAQATEDPTTICSLTMSSPSPHKYCPMLDQEDHEFLATVAAVDDIIVTQIILDSDSPLTTPSHTPPHQRSSSYHVQSIPGTRETTTVPETPQLGTRETTPAPDIP